MCGFSLRRTSRIKSKKQDNSSNDMILIFGQNYLSIQYILRKQSILQNKLRALNKSSRFKMNGKDHLRPSTEYVKFPLWARLFLEIVPTKNFVRFLKEPHRSYQKGA